jgi:phenylacetate-coenzyme A ligase PaaK-like adenylate-forming protein
MAGEPITQARLDTAVEAGIQACPRYGSMETGPIAYACLDPEAPDDTHILRDHHALIQVAEQAPETGLPPRALLITNLLPKTPFTMLNFSMGDEADIVDRACGCPTQQLGWAPHLKNIRSYEKLTAVGVTFHDTDLINVLERVLPAQFGGDPSDYQLAEREDVDGRPYLALIVHPRLGELNDARVKAAFLCAIGDSPLHGLMASMWRESNVVRVDRRAPHSTGASKILHLHVDRPKKP